MPLAVHAAPRVHLRSSTDSPPGVGWRAYHSSHEHDSFRSGEDDPGCPCRPGWIWLRHVQGGVHAQHPHDSGRHHVPSPAVGAGKRRTCEHSADRYLVSGCDDADRDVDSGNGDEHEGRRRGCVLHDFPHARPGGWRSSGPSAVPRSGARHRLLHRRLYRNHCRLFPHALTRGGRSGHVDGAHGARVRLR